MTIISSITEFIVFRFLEWGSLQLFLFPRYRDHPDFCDGEEQQQQELRILVVGCAGFSTGLEVLDATQPIHPSLCSSLHACWHSTSGEPPPTHLNQTGPASHATSPFSLQPSYSDESSICFDKAYFSMLFLFDLDHYGNCIGDIVGGGFDDGHLNITMRGQLAGGKIYSNQQWFSRWL